MNPPDSQSAKLKLEQVGEELTMAAGDCVVKQGDPPLFFYVVISGKLKVYRETNDGIRTDLTSLGPGEYFGEVALVTGKPRTATVEAVEDSVLLAVSKEEFDSVLDQNPKLARQIIHSLSQWLVEGDKRLEKETVHQVKLRQISWFDYALIAVLSLVLALVFNLYNDNQIPLVNIIGDVPGVEEISLPQALDLYKKKEAIFVDARKSNFYEQRHIEGSLNLPVLFFDLQYPMFQFMLMQQQVPKDKPVVVYGGTVSRRFDKELAKLLKERDFPQVMILGGDYQAWERTFPLKEQKEQKVHAMPLGLVGYLEWVPVGIFSAYSDSAGAPQPLSVGGLPPDFRGNFRAVCAQQNHAACRLRPQCGGIWHDAGLGRKPLVPGPPLGGVGGRSFSDFGHSHPGGGHRHRRHEYPFYYRLGKRHLSGVAHQLRLCGGGGGTGNLVEGSEKRRDAGHGPAGLPLRPPLRPGPGRFYLAGEKDMKRVVMTPATILLMIAVLA
jgi:rhodanese-related sulfurtransferase